MMRRNARMKRDVFLADIGTRPLTTTSRRTHFLTAAVTLPAARPDFHLFPRGCA
jgi:hypothetical protein